MKVEEKLRRTPCGLIRELREPRRGGGVEQIPLERLARPLEVAADHALDLLLRAALADGALQHEHLLRLELGAEQIVEDASLSDGERLPRERHEHRALPLDEIAAARLARELFVAEHPEQVVAQLEGDSDRQSELGERPLLLLARPCEGGPDEQRRLDAVLGRLVDEHAGRSVELLRMLREPGALLLEHVEVLTHGDLAPHPVEVRARGPGRVAIGSRLAGGREQLVGPRLEQVAEEDRGRDPEMLGPSAEPLPAMHPLEAPMRGGAPAPRVRAVDDVVVDECGGVEQLERAGGVEHGREAAIHLPLETQGVDRAVAVHGEERSEALAAREKGDRLVEEGRRVGAEGFQFLAMLGENVVQALLYEACESRGFLHPTSLSAQGRRRLGYAGFLDSEGIMALSEHEQRLLDEMERRLYQSEADLLPAASGVPRRFNYRSLVLGTLLALVGVGALVGGAALQQLWLGLIGFCAMLGGVLLMFSKRVEIDADASSSGERRSAPQKETLSERAERRWDERMGGGQ